MHLIIIAIALAILIAFLKRPEVKGRIGEEKTKLIIGKGKESKRTDDTFAANINNSFVNENQYVINNLVLQHENGKTSQIDHIVINQNGVFVVETKNYSGYIYGDDVREQWTQVLNYGKVKNNFYSPVKQNQRHCQYIQKLLPENTPIYSAVVFAKGNISNVRSNYVYDLLGLKKILNNQSEVQISNIDIENIYKILKGSDKSSVITNEQHVENIRKTQEDIANGICPRCRGRLVLRKGKYGDFWGCSNYPKCTFKVNR